MNCLRNYLFVAIKGTTSWKVSSSYGIRTIEPYRHRSRWAYRIRYFVHLLRMDRLVSICSDINEDILKESPDLIVISGSLIYEPFVKQLRFFFPNIRIKYCYNNIVKSKASISPDVLFRYSIEGWSWDLQDCKLYNLNYNKPSFNKELLHRSNSNKYDVCFIGKEKGRYETVARLQKLLEKMGFICYIKIMPNYSFLLKFRSYYSKPISYEDYLDIVASSRCIIDLVQEGQAGTTMRVLEALFSQKKLITNNVSLASYDFYDKQNIFILGRDPLDSLSAFLGSEFKPISPLILSSYSTEQWISKMVYD